MGETVYYEVVGFTDDGTPIMNPGNNSKLNDKEFTKQYGKTTTFSYGCAPDGKEHPKSNLFVYRMTMTNEDGDVVEYPPDFMRYRCEQMGVKYVPLMYRGLIPEEEIIFGFSKTVTPPPIAKRNPTIIKIIPNTLVTIKLVFLNIT